MAQKTEWLGLWKKREGIYASYPISQKQIRELPKKSRIILRYNKFYEKDTSRPRFIFSFMDESAADDFCFQLKEYSTFIETLEKMKFGLKKISDLTDVCCDEDFTSSNRREVQILTYKLLQLLDTVESDQ